MLGSLWHDIRLMNALSVICSTVALVLFSLATLVWLTHRPVFVFKHIELEGQFEHINRAAIREHALPVLQGNFFTMNLAKARQAFENVPWVRKATVRRMWPNRLRVSLVEHEVLGYWGENRLVSRLGEVFSANVAEAESQSIGKLPILHGPKGSQSQVVERYFLLNDQLSQLNLQVLELRLSDRFAWTAVLDNGLRVEFGVDRSERPMQEQLALFLKSYPVVMAQMMKKLAVFDLRYPSGFALAANSR